MPDIDATNFINAAGITDNTQISAIDTLVTSLKSNNLWTKLYAIYPFVGGTATTHKWNLKDPQDTDAAYRLVFSGGLTHASTGITPNGTTGFANTFLIPNITNFPTSTYISMGYYSRTSGYQAVGGTIMGSFSNPSAQTTSARIAVKGTQSGGPNISIALFNYADGVAPHGRATTPIVRIQTVLLTALTRLNGILKASINAVSPTSNAGDLDGSGFYIGTRLSTGTKLFARGVEISNQFDGTTTFAPPTFSSYLFAYNNRGLNAFNFTNRECAFAHIGVGLTAAECVTLNTIVDNYQTTLGRKV
jgi:hypothetical protein